MFTPDAFTVQLTGEVVIASTWPRSVVTCDAAAQTHEPQLRESAAQTDASAQHHDQSVNTERRTLPQATLHNGQYVYDTRDCAAYHAERAAAFVERSKTTALAMLRRSARRARALAAIAASAYGKDSSDDDDDSDDDNDGGRSTTRGGGKSSLRCVYTLAAPPALRNNVNVNDDDNDGDVGSRDHHALAALAVSCNVTSTLMAVAYGRVDVSGWCSGTGGVCVWHALRLGRDVAHAPPYVCELDSYATCVAFHPSSAQTLATATYDGDVLVYVDLTERRTTSPRARSELSTRQSSWSHREAVTCLQWLQNTTAATTTTTAMTMTGGSAASVDAALRQHLLASAAQDGVVALWSLSNRLVTPLALYQVQSRHHTPIGVTALSYTRTTTATATAATGGAAAALSAAGVDGALLVGLESGELGRGYTNVSVATATALAAAQTTRSDDGDTTTDNNDDDDDARTSSQHAAKTTASRHRSGASSSASPTPLSLDVSWLDAHAASVLSLCASPFLRHVAVSASGDGSARVYSALDRRALLTLEPVDATSTGGGGDVVRVGVCAAAFSPLRPCVLALVTQSGALHVYDLQQSHTTPVCSAAASRGGGGGHAAAAAVCLAFDRTGLLVTGDECGVVRVWRLPHALTHMTAHERAVLQSVRAGGGGGGVVANEQILQALFGLATQ